MTGKNTKKLLALMLALCFAAFSACAKKSEEKADSTITADKLWTKNITVKTEKIEIDSNGYPIYILAGGKSILYVGDEPGERPYLLCADGTRREFTITTRDGGPTKAILKGRAQPNEYYSEADIAALESDGDLLFGSKRINSYRPVISSNNLVNNGSEFVYLSWSNDFGSVKGCINAQTGEFISGFLDEGIYCEPYSGYRGYVISRSDPKDGFWKCKVFDPERGTVIKTFSPLESIRSSFPEGSIIEYGTVVFLGDGSFLGFCDASLENGAYFYAYVVRDDGGVETYRIGRDHAEAAFAMSVISNDPNYIIVVMQNGAVYMVDRAQNNVCMLEMSDGKLVKANIPEELPKIDSQPKDTLFFIDYLDDGETLLFLNRGDGSLNMFRPDTMETKFLANLSFSLSEPRFSLSGDHKGRICCNDRGGEQEAHFVTLLDSDTSEPIVP